MIYGSVCSGIEAATVAWHPLGWKPAWFCENDKFPSQVLNHRYPDVPNLGDMTIIEERPEYHDRAIQLLVGGTPCQSFSIAGLRKGLADDRGNLALKFCRILQDLQPRWFVWENVPGVLSSNSGRDFAAILSGFRECGYGFAYRVLDAQHFGVPQRRRRVFVVGHLGNWRPAAAVLFERESVRGYPAPRREKGERVAPTLDVRAGRSGENSFATSGGLIAARESGQGFWQEDNITGPLRAEGENRPSRPSQILAATFRYQNKNDGLVPDHRSSALKASPSTDERSVGAYVCMAHGQGGAEVRVGSAPTLTCNHEAPILAHCLRAEGFDASEDGTGRQNLVIDHGIVDTMVSNGDAHSGFRDEKGLVTVAFAQNTRDEVRLINGDGQITGALAAETGMKQPSYVAYGFKGGQGSKAGGIGWQEETAPKVGAADSGTNREPTILKSSAVRRLTPRECERLQGFPDDYTLIPINNRGGYAADGPRYKALGNSMAVPCMRWIGERIAMVDKIA